MNISTFFIRLLQLALVGLFIMGLFAVGIFVFLLTFGVIAILGAVYWLRGKGIIRSENAPSFTEDGAEYYVETVDIHTEKPDEKPTVIDVEFQEIDKK